MIPKALLLAVVVLWTHQALHVDSRSKFVLGIRNGTLFLQQTGDPGKSLIAGYPIEQENDPEETSSSAEIRNDIMQNDDPSNNYTSSGWSDIEKLLDTDIASESNRERNRENFELKNRTGNVANKPLEAILSEDDYDNKLEDSQTIMDNIMAENNPSDTDSTDDVYDDSEDRRQMLINSELMNKAKDDLTSAVRIDCMRVFAKRSKTDIDIMRPNNDCQKIDTRGAKHLPIEDTKETTKKEELQTEPKNTTADETTKDNIMLNATNANAKNNDHELSIIEVSMMPDDYMASNSGSHHVMFKKEKSNTSVVKEVASQQKSDASESEGSDAAHRHTVEKSNVEDKDEDKSNRTELIPDLMKNNASNINSTSEMPPSPKNLSTNAKQDSRIIEVKMLPGDGANTELGSKKHVLKKMGNKTDLSVSKNSSSLNSTDTESLNSSSLNSTDTGNLNSSSLNSIDTGNLHSSSLNSTDTENLTKTYDTKKKHNVEDHDIASKNKTTSNSKTTNEFDKKQHIDANTTTTKTKTTKEKAITKENRKEHKTSDKNATKRNKVQHREKSKGKSSVTKHRKHKHSLKRKHKSSRAASKRRLVSNHVPFHRENNETNFKNLNEEDKEKKKNAGPHKNVVKQQPVNKATNENQIKPEVLNVTKALNKTEQKRVNDAKNINITDAFSKRPTIAPRGISKNKAQVLQVDPESETDKSDAQQNTPSEYVKDEKYPNLGIFRHAGKEGQSVEEEKEKLDSKDTEEATARKTVVNETMINYNGTVNNASADAPANVTLKRILCFGDSLTKGIYAKGEIYHPYTIKLRELFGQNRHINYNIINHGMNGECVSRTMKTRLADDLQNLPKLDLVVILGGTNDLLHEDCSRKVDLFQQIKDMHKSVQDKGYKSVVVTIPESHIRKNGTDKMTFSEYNDAIEDVNQKLRVFAATEKLPLVDLADEFPRHTLPGRTHMASFWDDNVHPTAKGYDRIGEIMYDDIKSWV